MIDSHTHLYLEQFDEDRAIVLQRAIDQGISDFLIPAIDSSYMKRMKELKAMAPEHIHLMMGLHPTHVKENYIEELSWVAAELAKGGYCGVGEIGIDLFWDKSYLKQQREAFAQQIQLSIDYQLPIAIHCREAFDEVFAVLDDFNCSMYIAKSSLVGPDFGAETKSIGFSSTLSLNISSGSVIITGPGLPLKQV